MSGEQSRLVLPVSAAAPPEKAQGTAAAYLTISVDDGHESDWKTAGLLARYGLKATFYIPKDNHERAVLSSKDIKQLGEEFEIGAHTMTHRVLPRLSEDEALREIESSKHWLEDLLGRRILAFCYPRGKYNETIRRMVVAAGFLGARTCHLNLNQLPEDPFLAGVSVQAFSHSPVVQIRHAAIEGNIAGLINYARVMRLATDWEDCFTRTLDWVEAHGGVAHLYLHSWEIAQFTEWSKLERVLQNASARPLTKVSNGELFERLRTPAK